MVKQATRSDMNREEYDKTLIPLLEEAVGYVLKHGKIIPAKPHQYSSDKSGSDEAYSETQGTIRSLQRNGFEIRMKDKDVSQSFGTYSLKRLEFSSRTLEMYFDGNKIVEAERFLGGKESMIMMSVRSDKKLKVGEWEIKEAVSLDELAKYLAVIRESITVGSNFTRPAIIYNGIR